MLTDLEWYDYVAWLGLAYVVIKQLVTENRITFEAQEPKKEHLQRLITALIYIPFVSVAAFKVHTVMILFVNIMIFQGMGEYIQIVFIKSQTKGKKNKTQKYQFTPMDRFVQCLSVTPSIGFAYSHFLASTILYNIFFIIIFVYLSVIIIQRTRQVDINDFHKIALYFFGIVWIAWPLSHVVVVLPSMKVDGISYGSPLLVVVLLTSWVSDGAGYYVGKKLGRTKAMPNISPNKTVEGFVAQVLFGGLFCLLVKWFQLNTQLPLAPFSWWGYMFVGVCVSFFGSFGDILESFVKRMGGVKDSGTFFTGHGGILDRFDTFLLACPFTLYFMIYFMIDGPESLYS